MAQYPPVGTDPVTCAGSKATTALFNPPADVKVGVINEGECVATAEVHVLWPPPVAPGQARLIL